MVMTISTAPIHDNEEEFATTEGYIETTPIPDVVTNDLLFFDVTALPIDKNIQTNERLLFHKDGVVPITPEIDKLSSYNEMSDVTVHQFNKDI